MDFLTEYDEAKVLEYIREEALEEGREEGRQEGREEGLEQGQQLVFSIFNELRSAGREAEALRFMTDAAYRDEFLVSLNQELPDREPHSV